MPMINGHYYKLVVHKGSIEYGVDEHNNLHTITPTSAEEEAERQISDVKHNFNEITDKYLDKVGLLSTAIAKLFLYIYHNRDVRTNSINITQKDLSHKLNISVKSVANKINHLKNDGLVKTTQNVIYIVPALAKGSASRRGKLMKRYIERPMDTHHKVMTGLNTYNKTQLSKIANKIIDKKMKEYHIGKTSRKTAWSRMIRQAIRYSDSHYSQYDVLNYYLTKRTSELINKAKKSKR